MDINETHVSSKEFYFETFKDIVETYNEKTFFCGDKLYIRINQEIIISIWFTGANPRSLNILKLEAKSRYGIIDENEVPFNKIFYETKKNSMDKTVIIKAVNASSGDSTIEWSVKMDWDDLNALNEIVLNYIDIFSAF